MMIAIENVETKGQKSKDKEFIGQGWFLPVDSVGAVTFLVMTRAVALLT